MGNMTLPPSGADTPSGDASQPAHHLPLESEVEYEITSLRTPGPHQTQTVGGLVAFRRALAPLRRLLMSRSRRLLFGALATLIILLLIALTLQGTIGQSHLDTTRLIPTSQRFLYFANGAGRGILRLDGHFLDEASLEGSGIALDAGFGWHTLDYSALPFAPLRCHFTVPTAPGDTCPLLPYTTSVKGPDRFYSGPGRVINLRASPAYLPARQLAALGAAINRALTQFSSSVILAVGDHYRSADGRLHVDNRPLIATLRFRLSVDPARGLAYNANPSSDCMMLCGADLPGSITASVVADWLYTNLQNGAVFDHLSGAPDSSQLLTFALTWDAGHWIATFVPYRYQSLDPDCAAAPTLLEHASSAFDLNDLVWNSNALAMAQGCLIGVPLFDAQGNKTNTYADFFMRCGALVAVNAAARRDAPAIPSASPNEMQAANSYYLPGA
ncbi:MAG: hypothetical protein ABI068_13125 [Ktedonobacterales bacterium]